MTESSFIYSQALEAQVAMRQHLVKQVETGDIHRLGDGHVYKGDKQAFWPAVDNHVNILETAVPYYWTPELCDVLEKAAPSLGQWTMRPDEFPSTTGFVYFGHPLHLPMPATRPGWAPPTMDMVAAGWKRFTATEFLVTTYLQTSVRAQGEMGMTVTLSAGQSLEEWIDWLLRYRRNPVDDEETLKIGLEEHERIMRERLELQARYIAAAMNFLNTPLLCTRSKGPPNRATRKRFEREAIKYQPEIQIIELRKRKYIDEVRAADGDVVTYTPHVRFMVGWADQGFWNTYHTKHGVLERWIMPFMKRASRTDLPFKQPSARIKVVKR